MKDLDRNKRGSIVGGQYKNPQRHTMEINTTTSIKKQITKKMKYTLKKY